MSNPFTTMTLDYKGKKYLVTESFVSPKEAVIIELNLNGGNDKIVEDYLLKSKILETCRSIEYQKFVDRISSNEAEKIEILDLENNRFIDNYEIIDRLEVEKRKFYIVKKKDSNPTELNNIEIAFYCRRQKVLINEYLVEEESNYIYFSAFILSLAKIEPLYVANPSDPWFYVDYIVDSFRQIDEKLSTDLPEIDENKIFELFVKELKDTE